MPTQVKCEKCSHVTIFDEHSRPTVCHMCGHVYGGEIKPDAPVIIPDEVIEDMTDFTESDEHVSESSDDNA